MLTRFFLLAATIGACPQRERVRAGYEHEIAEFSSEMERLAPNLKASEKFDEMAEKVKTVEETHNVNAKRLKTASQKFEDIKQLRIQSFIDAFDHVSKAIEEIYA